MYRLLLLMAVMWTLLCAIHGQNAPAPVVSQSLAGLSNTRSTISAPPKQAGTIPRTRRQGSTNASNSAKSRVKAPSARSLNNPQTVPQANSPWSSSLDQTSIPELLRDMIVNATSSQMTMTSPSAERGPRKAEPSAISSASALSSQHFLAHFLLAACCCFSSTL
jgi:hypothetical protein